jgi:hypothetical protein
LESLAEVDDLLLGEPHRPSQLPPASGLSWIRDLLEEVLEDVFDNVIDV